MQGGDPQLQVIPLADIRQLEQRIACVEARIKTAVTESKTTLVQLFGVGPMLAARFLGEVGDIGRFPSKHHFAAHTGTAPLEASSGQVARHRLSRAGDRKLNHALYMLAMVQVRRPSAGQAYYRRKLAEGSRPRTDQRQFAGLGGSLMAELQVNGVRLYYEEHGQGPPILCVHGTGGSALMWGAAVPELARRGRVIVYDRRGCTRSQRPDPYDKTSVAEHADDAAAVLEALEASPAAVIGRSYGGEVATDLALRYPERVRALVLLESASLNLSAEAAAWDESLRQRVQAAAAENPATVGESFIRAVLGDAAWDGFPAPVQQMFADNGPAIHAEVTGGHLQVDQAALAAIDTPTLLVAAAHSPEAFRQVTDAMATAIPNSRKFIVEGGHLINPADPAILRFLQELPS